MNTRNTKEEALSLANGGAPNMDISRDVPEEELLAFMQDLVDPEYTDKVWVNDTRYKVVDGLLDLPSENASLPGLFEILYWFLRPLGLLEIRHNYKKIGGLLRPFSQFRITPLFQEFFHISKRFLPRVLTRDFGEPRNTE